MRVELRYVQGHIARVLSSRENQASTWCPGAPWKPPSFLKGQIQRAQAGDNAGQIQSFFWKAINRLAFAFG